jgi:hypothetical protein
MQEFQWLVSNTRRKSQFLPWSRFFELDVVVIEGENLLVVSSNNE